MSTQLSEGDRVPPSKWPISRWQSVHILQLVRELNGRCIAILTKLARSSGNAEPCVLEIVNANRDLLRMLDLDTCHRAARFPILLLDIHFQNDEWWRWARSRRSRQWKGRIRPNCLPPRVAGELMRETLILAWHTARTDCGAASLLLGMPRAVATAMAELGLRDIEHIAATHVQHLHLRWSNRPFFWRQMLLAAHSGDDEALREIHLYGVQLLGSEIVRRFT